MKPLIALSIEDLSFSYSGKKALDQVGFKIRSGECTLLLGPNGAGKSTLFSLITRLYDTREGRIELCGFDIKQQTRKALAKLGVVFQQTTLDMDLTVMQNLRYHTALHGMGRKLAMQRIQQELERLNMFDRRFEKIRQLNGGHRRRVEIARALLHKPALLLLDEPTVGLDVPSRLAIVEYVHQLAAEEKLAVLWASHLIDEVYPDDHLIVLHKGRIKANGTVDEVLKITNTSMVKDAFYTLTQGGAGRMNILHYWRAMWGIIGRELWRFVTQRERFISALVRPLVWLFVFAAGFRAALGLAITPPYETYILYEVYITPGLIGMIQLFNGMQSSLSMVYDREMGSMRILMVCPLPRWFLLLSKLLAGTGVSILQVYVFLAIAWFYDIHAPWQGYLWILPTLMLSGLMLGALGLLLSSFIKQLENFAGVMNFVIFPMFFMSTALYPLWKMKESSVLLSNLARYNPFSQAVELIRFALYGQFNQYAFVYTLVAFLVFMTAAIIGYNPSKGMMMRKGSAQ